MARYKDTDMKKLILILAAVFMANTASAAVLEDVTILDVTSKADMVALKLHANSGPKDSYFLVDILKSDPAAFEKLSLVTQKLQGGDKFKLALNIKSFSMSPSGSHYRSPDVKFLGPK